MQHVQQLRDRFIRATLKDVESWPSEHKMSGRAEFLMPILSVNHQEYQAKNFILAVGSTPNIDAKLKQQTWGSFNARLIKSRIKTTPTKYSRNRQWRYCLELAQAIVVQYKTKSLHVAVKLAHW